MNFIKTFISLSNEPSASSRNGTLKVTFNGKTQYHTTRLFTLFILFLAIGTGCRKDRQIQPVPQPTAAVSIGGREYPTIAIGKQVWTTLNYAGPGGIGYNAAGDKPEYGKYYTFEEVKAIPLPQGWRLPTRQDYITMAQHQGIVLTDHRAKSQEAIKSLVSTTNWRSIPGTNTSGFNAQPGGYSFRNEPPLDGDIAEFWTVEGNTMSIQESAQGKTHNLSFYNNNSPEYRFNLRFLRSE